MDKKLPKIFSNKIDKSNNERVYYSSKDNASNEKKEANEVPVRQANKFKDSRTIYQKINNIFNSYDYVYKADVIITTKEWKAKKTIIGKSKGHLVTLENELIPVLEIVDIEKV